MCCKFFILLFVEAIFLCIGMRKLTW